MYNINCSKKIDIETSKMIVFYFLFISADRQTHNYDTKVLKLPSLPINPKAKGIKPQQDEIVSHIYKFTSQCHNQTAPSSEWR